MGEPAIQGLDSPLASLMRLALLNLVGEPWHGIEETPERWARMMGELTEGYYCDPGSLIKTFEQGTYDQMIVVGPIPFYSLCEHHLVPFFGDAWVGYLPSGAICGLSKLARLVEVFARRLQVQERLTAQVASTLHESELNPAGVGCKIRARHLCMEARGIRKAGAYTVTTSLTGAFLDNPETRAEFLRSCEG